jgi:hypothetical protein
MSDLLDRYTNSKNPRIVNIRNIPNLAVNFVDQQDTFQKGFVTFERPGDPTYFTDKATEFYTEERNNITTPDSFNTLEPDIPLNRWGPKSKYFNPGQPSSGQ